MKLDDFDIVMNAYNYSFDLFIGQFGNASLFAT